MTNELREALRAKAVKFADDFYDAAMQMVQAQVANMFRGPSPTPFALTPSAPKTKAQSVPPPPSGTRTRYSDEAVEEVLKSVVTLLSNYPKGMRKEGIKKHIDASKELLDKALGVGRESDQINMHGTRRAATYTLPSAGARAQASGRVVKRKTR